MMRSIPPTIRLTSAGLRREISDRSLRLADDLPHESTCGAIPSVLFQEADGAQWQLSGGILSVHLRVPGLEPAPQEVLHGQQELCPILRPNTTGTGLLQ